MCWLNIGVSQNRGETLRQKNRTFWMGLLSYYQCLNFHIICGWNDYLEIKVNHLGFYKYYGMEWLKLYPIKQHEE